LTVKKPGGFGGATCKLPLRQAKHMPSLIKQALRDNLAAALAIKLTRGGERERRGERRVAAAVECAHDNAPRILLNYTEALISAAANIIIV
jgi:hypothetical protein